MLSKINKSPSKVSIPCSYISSKMTKTSAVLKSVIKKTNAVSTQPIAIVELTSTQKEAALPFLTQEPKKQKSLKSKTVGRFFKKLAKSNKSEKTQQHKLTFVPIIQDDASVISTSTTSSVTAQRIWDKDTSVYHDLEKVVEWIGSDNESSQDILQAYMTHFDFTDMKLEQAFRNLCAKLYLKGETQQIDRVLYQFSARYYNCNTESIFGSIDVIHAVVYSLLLLNTDLHVAEGDYKKMSQSEFIKNTMNAISSGTPKIRRSSFDWTPLQRTPSSISSGSSICAKSLDSAVLPRNLSTLSIGSKTWESDIKSILKHMYSSIRHQQIVDPSTPSISKKTNSVKSALRRSVGTMTKRTSTDSASITSSTRSSIMQYEAVGSHLYTELPLTYTSTAPYYKEGIVSRKHLLDSKDQRAKHRDWKQCFMVIDRNQLNMYKLESSQKIKKNAVGAGDWISQAHVMCSIDLKHSLATVLPTGYNRQRQHAFTLEQSNGAKYVFQAGSAEQVLEWVSTCNYWAARESKEPLAQGISSMEYGWGRCLETASSVIIHDWQTPASPVISSILEEPTQLEVLHKHVEVLTTQLDQHRDIKEKIETRFMGVSKLSNKALGNWQNKSQYLLQEIIKYQNYCNSIEKSLSLQASAMA